MQLPTFAAGGVGGRHAIVADQRIGEHEDLAGVGRIYEGFRLTRNRRVEHDFALDWKRGPGYAPLDYNPVR